MRTTKKWHQRKQAQFLLQFKASGTIRSASEKAGIARVTYYEWMRHDPVFKAKFESVDAEVTDVLEQAAMKHAVDGNATLLIFLLKSRRPEKYREELHLTHRTMTLEDWLRGQGPADGGSGAAPLRIEHDGESGDDDGGSAGTGRKADEPGGAR